MSCIPCAIFLNNIKNFNTKTAKFNSLIEGKIIHITSEYVFIKSKKYYGVCHIENIPIENRIIDTQIEFLFDFTIDPIIKRYKCCFYRKYYFIKHIIVK